MLPKVDWFTWLRVYRPHRKSCFSQAGFTSAPNDVKHYELCKEFRLLYGNTHNQWPEKKEVWALEEKVLQVK